MKRALFVSILAAFGALMTVACSGNTDTLSNAKETGDENSEENSGDNEEEESASKTKSETKDPVQTPAETPKTETPAPTTNTGDQCTPDNTNPAECAKCCAQKHTQTDTCACGAGSACGDACGDNLCNGGIPSFECGICLFQSQCDFGLGFGGGDDGANFGNSELTQCLQQCAPQQ